MKKILSTTSEPSLKLDYNFSENIKYFFNSSCFQFIYALFFSKTNDLGITKYSAASLQSNDSLTTVTSDESMDMITYEEIINIKKNGLRQLLSLSNNPEFGNGNLGNSLPQDVRVSHYNDLSIKFNHDKNSQTLDLYINGNHQFMLMIIFLALFDKESQGQQFWEIINSIMLKNYTIDQLSKYLMTRELEIEATGHGFKLSSKDIVLTIELQDTLISETARFVSKLTAQYDEDYDIALLQVKLENAVKIVIYQPPNQRKFLSRDLMGDSSFDSIFNEHLLTTKKVPESMPKLSVLGAHHGYSLVMSYYSEKNSKIYLTKDQTAFIPDYMFTGNYNVEARSVPVNLNIDKVPQIKMKIDDFEQKIWELSASRNCFPPLLFKLNVSQDINEIYNDPNKVSGAIDIKVIESICNKTGQLFDLNRLENIPRNTVIMIDSTYFGNTKHSPNDITQWQESLASSFDTVIYTGSLGKDTLAWGERAGYIGSNNQEFNDFCNQSVKNLGLTATINQNLYLANQLTQFNKNEWEMSGDNAIFIQNKVCNIFDLEHTPDWLKVSKFGGAFGSLFIRENEESCILRFNLIPRDSENRIRTYNDNEKAFIHEIIELIYQEG